MNMTTSAACIAALLLSFGGLAAAWRAWSGSSSTSLWLAAMLTAWSAATALWVWEFGGEIGTALALETAAIAAFAFILSRVERRDARAQKERTAPINERAGRASWRGFARFMVAGPLGLVAALAVGIVVAVHAPLHEQTRLILGGLIVPSLWAALIVWTVAGARVRTPAIALTVLVVAGFGLALLPKG